MTKISKSKLNCAIIKGYWTTANSTVQKYKGRGCCQLNCAKVQRSQSQLCNPTGILDNCKLNCANVQRSQSQLCNPTGILDNCKLNCAKVQRSWMLPTQLCKSTKVPAGCCNLNCAKLQMLPFQLAWIWMQCDGLRGI